MPGPEHGGSDPSLSSPEGWGDGDATACSSQLLYMPGVWNGFAPSPCTINGSWQGLAWEGLPVVIHSRSGRKFSALPTGAGGRCRRAVTWHGGTLRAAQLPIERNSPLADACPGWPSRSATGTPARTSGVQIDSSALDSGNAEKLDPGAGSPPADLPMEGRPTSVDSGYGLGAKPFHTPGT